MCYQDHPPAIRDNPPAIRKVESKLKGEMSYDELYERIQKGEKLLIYSRTIPATNYLKCDLPQGKDLPNDGCGYFECYKDGDKLLLKYLPVYAPSPMFTYRPVQNVLPPNCKT